MKKDIVIYLCSVLTALLTASCGNNGRIVEPKGGAAHMVLMENEYDLGEVSDKDGVVEHEFVIANDGGMAFVLLSAKPQCDCTTVDFKPETVKPGYGTKVKVKLDVKAVSKGDFVREVDLFPSCQRDNTNGTIFMRGKKI